MTEYNLNSKLTLGNSTGLFTLEQPRAKYGDKEEDTEHLSFKTAHKMAKKLITRNRVETKEIISEKFSEEELAKKLLTTPEELDRLINPTPTDIFYRKTAGDISHALIKLYCNTKWAEDE